MSWKNESERHKLSVYGVKTTHKLVASGKKIKLSTFQTQMSNKGIFLVVTPMETIEDTIQFDGKTQYYFYSPHTNDQLVFVKKDKPFTHDELKEIVIKSDNVVLDEDY